MLVGKEVGPFTVERELGSGAMGTVYLARHQSGKQVALKFMSLSLGANQKALERFERECEILKQLRHPNIVRLLAHGRYQKIPFYAMELIEGESLDRVLGRRGRMTWEEVVSVGKQLCAALQHAHEKGIVHRDLKPSNLMLTRDGTLKLTDFGIAKDLDVTQITSANCTVGTASYMSPEQCKGERTISHKSDLYSLGIVFYELLTGRKPYLAENAMDMFLQHVKGTFERPSRVEMSIPVWLDTVVCHMMEKKPDKRPFDAATVGAALEQVTEKVSALRSAGVEAATSRTHEHVAAKATDQDREAARTLRHSLGKGGKKRKAKPFYARVWFQALLTAAALVGVGAMIVVALLPPSAESLFEDVKRVIDSKDPDKIDKAVELPSGAVRRYLRHYGHRADDMTRQVRDVEEQVEAERRDRALVTRMRTHITPDDEQEGKARAAIRHEEAGEFTQAVAVWKSLWKPPTESGYDQRVYNRVAERRLRDLTAADERLQQIRRKVELARGGQDVKPDSDSEAEAMEAVRYADFGDATLAFRRWAMIRVRHEKDAENRPLFLLAARQAHDLKSLVPNDEDKQEEKRREQIVKYLTEARARAAAGKAGEALLQVREVQALYAGQPKFGDLLKEANALAVQLAPARP